MTRTVGALIAVVVVVTVASVVVSLVLGGGASGATLGGTASARSPLPATLLRGALATRGEPFGSPAPGEATVASSPTAAPALPAAPSSAASPGPANAIVAENQQTGSDHWQLARPGFRTANDAVGQIKGYASATSVNKGESITLYVTVNPVQTYTIDVYRMGWYGGTGGRLLRHISPLTAPLATVRQPACPADAQTGLAACAWSPSYTLAVPTGWTTGVYLALLTNAQNYQNYIVFVVRDDGRPARFLFQQGVTTYQAYNNYSDDRETGKSLYDSGSRGAVTMAGSPRAVKVSFDRPYAADGGAGNFLEWEVYLLRWLERSGYDVSYATDVDTHANGARLLDYGALLSAGHDEYWTKQMYDAATAARDAGRGLGFFAANAIYTQARLEPSATGVANRVLVCYRDAGLDPVADPALKTVNWRDAPVSRPEQQLVGVQYTALLDHNFPYVVSNAASWVFEGTGFHDGDTVAGLTGYEVDRSWSRYPRPAAQDDSYAILSQSPVTDVEGHADVSQSSVYQAAAGGWVFATGTMSWNWALDRSGYVDARIQQATANVLRKLAP